MLCAMFFRIGVSLNKLCAAFFRKRCRKYNHGNLVNSEPFYCHIKVLAHIGIVSMTFVNNNDLSGKAEVFQHHMLLLQCRHQQLIDRSDNKIRKQGLLSSRKPVVHNESAVRLDVQIAVPGEQLPIVLIQSGIAVRKLYRQKGLLILRQPACPFFKTRKNSV